MAAMLHNVSRLVAAVCGLAGWALPDALLHIHLGEKVCQGLPATAVAGDGQRKGADLIRGAPEEIADLLTRSIVG